MSLGTRYLEDSHPRLSPGKSDTSLPLEENLHPQSSCAQGHVPIFPETPRRPEKLKEESRPPAATGNTQDEVLLEKKTHDGLWGGKGGSGAHC